MLKRLLESDKKLLVRFAVSLFVTIFLAVLFVTVRSYAEASSSSEQVVSSGAQAGE